MVNRNLVLSLLVGVVLASGCTNITGGNTDGPTQTEGSDAITIHDVSIEPRQIYEGASVRVILDIANTGRVTARIDAAEDGENVLKNYCSDIFSIADSGYQVTPAENSVGDNTYQLQTGQELKFQWVLDQEGNVPLIGYSCNLKLEVPFDYKVSAFRQFQTKQDRTIEGSTSLESRSSAGPLKLNIEVIGGTGEEGESTFVAGEDQTARVLLQLQNLRREDYAKGLVDVKEETLQINSPMLGIDEEFEAQTTTDCDLTGSSDARRTVSCVSTSDTVYQWVSNNGDTKCSLDKNTQLRMAEGQSRIITCDVEVPDSVEQPAVVSNIEASVNYTYIKDAGKQTVRVETRG
jgi:hypothetical protein